uniref:tRNA wybutosine-synthesizing protein 3 homolog n=1 Tax=Dermatophagoides pteronyssinus TaxID=6956 RepID=A0A6P6Y9P8_DERPT
CDCINAHAELYTTSSCSGRFQLLIFEPFIFHVKAASLDAALLVLAACQAAGVQDCGITEK